MLAVDRFGASALADFLLFIANLRDEVGKRAHIGFETQRARVKLGGQDIVDGDNGRLGAFAHEGRLRNWL